jgi:hypothetical protein
LLQLRRGGLGVGIERRRVREQRIAPAEQDFGAIARRNMVGVVDAGAKLLEFDPRKRGLGARGARGQGRRPEQGRSRGDPERAAHHLAAAIAPEDDVADGLRAGRAQRDIVVGLGSLGPVAELISFRHMQQEDMRK